MAIIIKDKDREELQQAIYLRIKGWFENTPIDAGLRIMNLLDEYECEMTEPQLNESVLPISDIIKSVCIEPEQNCPEYMKYEKGCEGCEYWK